MNTKDPTQLAQGLVELNIIHGNIIWGYGRPFSCLSVVNPKRSPDRTARPTINFIHKFTTSCAHGAKRIGQIMTHCMIAQLSSEKVTHSYHRRYAAFRYLNLVGCIQNLPIFKKSKGLSEQ